MLVKNKSALYRRMGLITIIAVYFLILVGSIVRTTGSGMGCPDWPTCFGHLIPPTDVSQLPENYKEIFKIQGKEIADFDAFKTWVEYINRLVGVLIGFFVLLTFVFSFHYRKKDVKITIFSFLSLVLVGFIGWLGAKVVEMDLKEGMVTIHMVFALLLVLVLIYTISRSFGKQLELTNLVDKSKLRYLLIFAFLGSFVQIVLGTQVREVVDAVAKEMGESARSSWIDHLGVKFYIHRSFSILLLAINVTFAFVIWNKNQNIKKLRSWTSTMIVVLLLTIFSGTALNYMGMPAMAQPAHLLTGSLLMGVQFYLLLLLFPNWYLPKTSGEIA